MPKFQRGKGQKGRQPNQGSKPKDNTKAKPKEKKFEDYLFEHASPKGAADIDPTLKAVCIKIRETLDYGDLVARSLELKEKQQFPMPVSKVSTNPNPEARKKKTKTSTLCISRKSRPGLLRKRSLT